MTTTSTTAPADTTAPTTAPPEAAKPIEAAAPPEAPPAEKPSEYWQKRSAEEKRARKEADRIAAERKAAAEERKALEAERAAHAERVALIDRAKAGDWEAREKLLAETGVTYDELTKRALNSRKGDSVAEKTAREVAELKAQLERERADAAKRAESETWSQTVGAFTHHVTKEAAAEYPVLAGEIEADPDLIDSTLRSMERIARESGQPITLRDAAVKMEQFFRQQAERRVARLRPAAPETAPQTSETKPRDQRGRFERGDGPRKLTNDLSAQRSSPPKGRNEPSRPLTMRERDEANRERLRRAASAMR
jgi:colicin import membrane protein